MLVNKASETVKNCKVLLSQIEQKWPTFLNFTRKNILNKSKPSIKVEKNGIKTKSIVVVLIQRKGQDEYFKKTGGEKVVYFESRTKEKKEKQH